jgi:hypothetical protein
MKHEQLSGVEYDLSDSHQYQILDSRWCFTLHVVLSMVSVIISGILYRICGLSVLLHPRGQVERVGEWSVRGSFLSVFFILSYYVRTTH